MQTVTAVIFVFVWLCGFTTGFVLNNVIALYDRRREVDQLIAECNEALLGYRVERAVLREFASSLRNSLTSGTVREIAP